MSEYLNRLKWLRDSKPPPGNAPNVQHNVSFRKAIDYIEDLEHKIVLAENQERYLLARLKEADDDRIPEELFDSYTVYHNLNNKQWITSDKVSDVLDTVVRMIRERLSNG